MHACFLGIYLLQMAFEGRQPQDRNAQQLLCARVGLHAFMLSLAERVEHLLNESKSSDVTWRDTSWHSDASVMACICMKRCLLLSKTCKQLEFTC